MSTAVASYLLRCTILEAINAPIITAEPPINADMPACKPDITNEAIATIAVAISCKRNILLKIEAVVIFSIFLSLQKQVPAFEMGFSKVRDFELLRLFSQALSESFCIKFRAK